MRRLWIFRADQIFDLAGPLVFPVLSPISSTWRGVRNLPTCIPQIYTIASSSSSLTGSGRTSTNSKTYDRPALPFSGVTQCRLTIRSSSSTTRGFALRALISHRSHTLKGTLSLTDNALAVRWRYRGLGSSVG